MDHEDSGRTGRTLSRLIPFALLVLLPLIFYSGMVFQDLEPISADSQAHKPVGEWALESSERLGETPEWFPHIFSGMPSYGSFLYIPRPATNVFGQALQIFKGSRGARYVVLFSMAGILTFLFLRRQGFSIVASTLGGLAYSMTPYMTGLVAASHSTKLEALCFVPGLLLALDYMLARPGPLAAALMALFAATLAWANHPQIFYYAALVLGLYALGILITEKRKVWNRKEWISFFGFTALAGALALALIAEPYLAIQEYTPHSIRGGGSGSAVTAGTGGGVGWEYATAWSFAPSELVTFLFPAWYGLEGSTYWGPLLFTQSSHYFGILVLALAAWGLVRGSGSRRWIWLGISLFVLVVGFGKHVPVLYRPMYELLPLFDKFRVPAMIYSILPLTLGYLVCSGLDSLGTSLASGGTQVKGKRSKQGAASNGSRRWLYALGGVIVLWVLVQVGARSNFGAPGSMLHAREVGQAPQEYVNSIHQERFGLLDSSVNQGMAVVVLAIGLIALASSGRLPRRRSSWIVGAVAFLALADIWIVDKKFYDPVPVQSAEQTVAHLGAVEFLAAQEGTFRIFPLGNLFGSNAYAVGGLESVGGYQPAKLQIYDDLLTADLIRVPVVWQMLNVRYLLSSTAVNAGAPPVYEGDGFVYDLGTTLGPLWSVSRIERLSDVEQMLGKIQAGFDPSTVALLYDGSAPTASTTYARAELELLSRDLHEIRFRSASDGDAFVVLSEIYYEPAWTATVDGAEVDIHQTNHVLRGLEVPAGEHEVVLRYASPARTRGVLANRIASGAVLLLFVVGVVAGRRRGQEPAA